MVGTPVQMNTSSSYTMGALMEGFLFTDGSEDFSSQYFDNLCSKVLSSTPHLLNFSSTERKNKSSPCDQGAGNQERQHHAQDRHAHPPSQQTLKGNMPMTTARRQVGSGSGGRVCREGACMQGVPDGAPWAPVQASLTESQQQSSSGLTGT